jgi:hypothetical protein
MEHAKMDAHAILRIAHALSEQLERIETRVAWLERKFPPPYSEANSKVYELAGGVTLQRPAGDWGGGGMAGEHYEQKQQQLIQERRENIRNARESKSHVTQLREEFEHMRAELEKQGNAVGAEAVRQTLARISGVADQALDWLERNIGIKEGCLVVGIHESCQVGVCPKAGPPYITFKAQCTFEF